MKKFWAVVMIVVLALSLAACGGDTSTQSTGVVEKAEEASTLGDYGIEIKSCRLAKDYLGKDVVIVNYGFTNNSDEPAAFFTAFDDQVYQDGIGLNEAYMLNDSANYSSDNQMKEIKTGATLDVEVAYELNDTTTDIEVEVSELISFDDTVVKKTFTIAQ